MTLAPWAPLPFLKKIQRLQFTFRSSDEWLWCFRQGFQHASLLTSSWLLYQQPWLIKTFLQLYFYSKCASFTHSSWSDRWRNELPKTHGRSLCVWENYTKLIASFLIPSECVVYWESLFCKRLLLMGANVPGLVCMHTLMGKGEIWINIETCWQQLTSSKIFRPLDARSKNSCRILQWINRKDQDIFIFRNE